MAPGVDIEADPIRSQGEANSLNRERTRKGLGRGV